MSPQPDQGEAGAPAEAADDDTIAGMSREEVVAQFNSRLKLSKSHWDEWRTEARMLYDLVASRQWDAEDEAAMKEQMRPMVTLNIAGKYMDVMTGLQINNRQDIRYYPREQGDAQVNELMTGAVSWASDLCNAPDEESDSFFDCALTGVGWIEGYLDTDLEPGGVPARRRVDNMEMFPDPAAKKSNFGDAKYIIRLRYVDEDEYEELMGEAYTGGGTQEDSIFGIDTEDDGIHIIEEPQDYSNTPGGGDSSAKRRRCAVADYQFWRKESRWLASAPGAGERELTEAEYTAYQPFFKAAQVRGAPMQLKQIRRKIYYRCFISQGEIGKSGLSPYQQGFTYHGITGKRDRNKNVFYGVGRSLVDPQKWLNKLCSSILHAIATNAKGGIMAEEDAFKDVRKAEAEWADPASITWLKKGALVEGKVAPKPSPAYPQGMDRLMEFTLQSLPQVTGIPVELLGLSERQQPGIVEAQRKQSAMSVIAWAFDAMRRYYRSVGAQMARYVIDYVPEGTLVMVAGDAGKQYIPLLKNRLAVTFDIIVDEAPTSTNQQERTWAALQGLIPMALSAQIPVPPSVIKYAPIPQDLISEWMKLLQPDPQKQQVTQQQATASLRKLMSEAAKNETQAQKNMADAQRAQAEAGTAGADSQLKTAQALEHAAHAGAAQAHHM